MKANYMYYQNGNYDQSIIQVIHCVAVRDSGLDQQTYSILGPVNIGMGDWSVVQLPVQQTYTSMAATQVNSAWPSLH